ncbi:MAG TPA: D-2-hydroxyacid dehydrogenase [Pirellulales bacterium]|nr:D-2-hydroxyacid dehydrogenase [Pirellulales bacterium]
MRIVLCYPVEAKHLAQIQAAAPQAEIVDAGQNHIARELAEADIFCGHAKVPVDWDGAVRRGRLRWIQSSAAGMDHCLVPSVVASDITVTSASGLLGDQVSEQALALLLGVLRGLPVFFRAQQKREFIRRPTRDLTEARVLIVGFGGVGRRIAEVLRPFRPRIFATDMFAVDRPDYVARLLAADRLDELLPEADIVIISAPLTATTRGMFDARRIGLMPRGSILINVARGPIVVEQALIDALESGHLHAAGLDVTEVEPLPHDSRLWVLPNLILTPHVGGQSFRRAEQVTDFFAENLRRYQAGEPLLNLVDKQLGFPIRTGKPA